MIARIGLRHDPKGDAGAPMDPSVAVRRKPRSLGKKRAGSRPKLSLVPPRGESQLASLNIAPPGDFADARPPSGFDEAPPPPEFKISATPPPSEEPGEEPVVADAFGGPDQITRTGAIAPVGASLDDVVLSTDFAASEPPTAATMPHLSVVPLNAGPSKPPIVSIVPKADPPRRGRTVSLPEIAPVLSEGPLFKDATLTPLENDAVAASDSPSPLGVAGTPKAPPSSEFEDLGAQEDETVLNLELEELGIAKSEPVSARMAADIAAAVAEAAEDEEDDTMLMIGPLAAPLPGEQMYAPTHQPQERPKQEEEPPPVKVIVGAPAPIERLARVSMPLPGARPPETMPRSGQGRAVLWFALASAAILAAIASYFGFAGGMVVPF